MSSLLRVEKLKKYFPGTKDFLGRTIEIVRAVDGIDFELHQGETLGLVGESGCGKSTTGRLIMRLIDPSDGLIWFKGKDITKFNRKTMRSLRVHMQIIFQDPYSSLNPRKTVKEIIGEGLKLHNHRSASEKKELILETMNKVGLRPEHYQRYPHEFSGGQRQRIGIARSIILNPDLIIADEPVSALDVSIQAQVINLLEKLKHELKLSYLFISHDLSVVEHVSDRVAVMYLGKIVELAPRDGLYNQPRHPYTISLLSAIPVPEAKIRKKRIILKGEIPSALNLPTGCRFHPRCQFASDDCHQQEPLFIELESGHWVACHHPAN